MKDMKLKLLFVCVVMLLLLGTSPKAMAIVVGFNSDIHMDVQGVIANDFHVQGRIESGDPCGNWSKPPILIDHIDGGFPNFTYSVTHDPAGPGQNWYIVTADWWGMDYPYCSVLHLGLFFDATCHNVVVDLVGWWTKDGSPIPPYIVPPPLNGGAVPIPGFNVQDLHNPQVFSLFNDSQLFGGGGGGGGGGIETEIVQMDLVGLTRERLEHYLGPLPQAFRELHVGGAEVNLPWVPVANYMGPISMGNPIYFLPDSFFDVFLDMSGPIHPMTPITIPSGGFLVARELQGFTNNNGLYEYRWVWHIHEAHLLKPLIEHSKWSQPPVEINPQSMPVSYFGWDEISVRELWEPPENWNIVADDFRCLGSMPVTSIHWWGSYFDWEQGGGLPPVLPIGWKICFWSNVPANPLIEPGYSYPKQLLWQIDVDANRVEVNEVGTDSYFGYYPNDICYQYTLQLKKNEWFWQGKNEPNTIDNVFWMSIAALYPNGPLPQYPWGWKTRPWHWMDDATRFQIVGPLLTGMVLDPYGNSMYPIVDPIYQESVDVAFELDTDPNYIKWEQHYTGIRDWPHYDDVNSLAKVETIVEPITKWYQNPDLSTTGVDVDAYEDIWRPQVLADDFRCIRTGPITNINIWGSWYHNHPPFNDPTQATFTLSIHEDLPVGNPRNPNPWSMPGNVLWMKTFQPGQFTVGIYGQDLREGWFVPCSSPQYYDPFADTICYNYSFPINPGEAFQQLGSSTHPVIYWLDVQAQPMQEPGFPEPIRFGVKDSTTHYNDNAVWAVGQEPIVVPGPWHPMSYPPGHPYAGSKIDLAFQITTNTSPPIKYTQMPDLGTTTSIDIDATKDKIWQPQVLADDFNCTSTDPITDIHIWGSWYHDMMPYGDPNKVIFKLSILSNIPAGAGNPYSKPGTILWQREFQPGEFTVSTYANGQEGYMVPCSTPPYYEPQGDNTCFKYDFNIDPCGAFVQLGTPGSPVVYWLSVEARQVPPQAGQLIFPMRSRFGWKTRDPSGHFMDDAVWSADYGQTWNEMRYPSGHPLAGTSIDLAFSITSQKTHTNLVLKRRVADDWQCKQKTPVTAIVWWGSYLGYGFEPGSSQFMPLPVKPDYFELMIWSDVPAVPGDPNSFSHPGNVIWQYRARAYDEVLVGYDKKPLGEPNEPVFRYSVRIPDPNQFHQSDVNGIYWLSVMAVYDVNRPNYDWGWTNHKHVFNDDAAAWEQDPTGLWRWVPLKDQTGETEDMSFILFTVPPPTDCLIGGNAGAKEYSDWVAWGKPNCWCYCRQCRGDADGKKTLANWVAVPDLNALLAAYNKNDAVLRMIPNGICADFDHKKTLAFRVTIPDLNILLAYFNKPVGLVPICNLPPIITGPYNFWCGPAGCPMTCP